MKTRINDTRREERNMSAAVDIDGQIIPDDPNEESTKYGGRHVQNYDEAATADHRSVAIRREDGDDIPKTLQGQNYPFSVNWINLAFARQFTNTATDPRSYRYIPPEWKLTQIRVGGPNIRKDGSHGEKPQSVTFPTQSWYDCGVYTEDDITAAPGYYLYDHQVKRVGQPKKELRTDPLPSWVAAILTQVSPVTGVPFVMGDTHRFGTFVVEQAEESA